MQQIDRADRFAPEIAFVDDAAESFEQPVAARETRDAILAEHMARGELPNRTAIRHFGAVFG